MLYICDEVFFVGTAAEITPIRSIDKIQIGKGQRGPVAEALQVAFFDMINGETPDRHGWLTYVYPGEPLQPAEAGLRSAPGAASKDAARQPDTRRRARSLDSANVYPCTSTTF
jgi:hypothetical protein